MNLELKEKYKTIKNALIIEPNEKLLEEYKKLLDQLDSEESKKYLEEYNNYSFMTLTLEEEEERLSNLIKLITERKNSQENFKEDYKYITNTELESLTEIKNQDKLTDFNTRLSNLRLCLNTKQELIEIRDKRKELTSTSPNNKTAKQLAKLDKKENNLIDRLLDEPILMLLYEFCIIDTFEKDNLNLEELVNNLINSSEIKREKKELVVEELPKDQPQETPNEEAKEKDYKSEIIPEDMPILTQIGTVKPVNIMKKLEETQEELNSVNLPSMGLLNNDNKVKLDSNEFIKNSEKTS